MTLSRMTLFRMTLSGMTLCRMTLSRGTLRRMTTSRRTFGRMTLSRIIISRMIIRKRRMGEVAVGRRGSWSKGKLVEGHFVDLLLLVAVGRLYTSWSTIHLPKRGVLVRSKSVVRIELALRGAEIFTFKVVAFKAFLTLSLPWLMTC